MKNSQSHPPQEDKHPSFLSFVLSLFLLVATILAFKDSILDANNIPSGSMLPTLKIGDYLFVNKMRYSLRVPFLGKEILRIDDPQRGDIVTFLPPVEEGKHYVKRVMGMPGDLIRLLEMGNCELKEYMRKTQRLGSQKKLEDSKHSLFCNKGTRHPDEPIITFLEYRKQNKGPWKHYLLEEVSQKLANKELLDSDSENNLPPEYYKNEEYYQPLSSTLYHETVNNSQHLIVESAAVSSTGAIHLCPEIHGSGCIVPQNYYFVMGDNRDHSKDSRIIGFIHRDRIYGKATLIYFSINWRDDICAAYWRYFREGQSTENHKLGFPLNDFPPEEQYKYCTSYDLRRQEPQTNSSTSSIKTIGAYLYHTIHYRILRMSVRWGRLGTLIE